MPPQPPTPVLPGKSTVSTEGEIHNFVNPLNLDRYHPDNLPYGLGPRVPMIVISPWTKGGYVCSEVFDHTSLIRFIETCFGVRESNITPWRRAICGDLTSAFDFKNPNGGWPKLPDTKNYIEIAKSQCRLKKPGAPEKSIGTDLLKQEEGFRPARPLPYDFEIDENLDRSIGEFTLTMTNHGALGACFYVYKQGTDEIPRRYTVEAGKALEDTWSLPISDPYDFALTGPNGFFRRFQGISNSEGAHVTCRHDSGEVLLKLSNRNAGMTGVNVADNAYGMPTRQYDLAPGQVVQDRWKLVESGHWYDLTVTCKGHIEFSRRMAGHVETGSASITDPAASEPLLQRIRPVNPSSPVKNLE
jgi:phospholipase C